MDLDTFQQTIIEKKRKPIPGGDYHADAIFCALETAGEAGELANLAKKAWRDDDMIIDEDRKEAMLDEYGDIFFAVALGISVFGVTLEELGQHVIAKLEENVRKGHS